MPDPYQLYSPTYDLGGGYDFDDVLSWKPNQAPANVSQFSPAEQLSIFQTALSSGLQIFSTVFGAVLAINQQEQTALTQSGQSVPVSQLGGFAIKTAEGDTVAEGDTSLSTDVPNWVIPGLIGLGLLLVAIPRR